jgi:hypothetical protein
MSLFKRPAWSQNVTAADDSSDEDNDDGNGQETSGAGLFSHSSSFMSIMKDSERQKKLQEEKKSEREKRQQEKSAEKAERKAETKRTSSGEGAETDDKGELKKRRINSEDSAALLGMIGVVSPSKTKVRSESKETVDSDDDADTTTPTTATALDGQSFVAREKGKAPEGRRTRANQVTLSDDEDVQFVSEVPRQARSPAVPAEEEDSDPELAELSRKARARHNAQQTDRSDRAAGSKDQEQAARPAPILPDATIKIFISSPIEGTAPLIIYRKLSQRLQEVREVWCAKQKFSKEFSAKVFLTHRGHRLYDLTFCRSLGLEADEHGRVTRTDDRTQDGVDSVHVEAMTEELFKKFKSAKALQAQGVQEVAEDEPTTAAAEIAQDAPPGQQYVRVVIRARGHDDFKVLVKPVSSLMFGCHGKDVDRCFIGHGYLQDHQGCEENIQAPGRTSRISRV